MGFTPNLRGLKNLMRCGRLEKLAISIPTDEMVSFPSLVEVIWMLEMYYSAASRPC
jgi:hypothetical protein